MDCASRLGLRGCSCSCTSWSSYCRSEAASSWSAPEIPVRDYPLAEPRQQPQIEIQRPDLQLPKRCYRSVARDEPAVADTPQHRAAKATGPRGSWSTTTALPPFRGKAMPTDGRLGSRGLATESAGGSSSRPPGSGLHLRGLIGGGGRLAGPTSQAGQPIGETLQRRALEGRIGADREEDAGHHVDHVVVPEIDH